MKRSARIICLSAILLALLFAMIACTGGSGGADGQATAAAATAQYGADQFHLQLTAQAQEGNQ